MFENNENKQKDAVVGPFKKLHFSIQLKTAILNVRVKTTTFEKFSRYLNVLTETKKTRNQVSDKTKKRRNIIHPISRNGSHLINGKIMIQVFQGNGTAVND